MPSKHTAVFRFRCQGADSYELELVTATEEQQSDFTMPYEAATWQLIVQALAAEMEANGHSAAVDRLLAEFGGPQNLAVAAGRALSDALLDDHAVRSLFARVLTEAGAAGTPLRVEMHFGPQCDTVANLPWPLLHFKERFLVGTGAVTVSRVETGTTAANQREEARQAIQAAHDAVASGEWADAVLRYREAIALLENSGEDQVLAQALLALGNIYIQQAEPVQAAELYEQALALLDEEARTAEVAQLKVNLGNAYRQVNKRRGALSLFEEAADIFSELDDAYGLANTWSNMALLYLAGGQTEAAKPLLASAYLAFGRLQAPEVDAVAAILVEVFGSSEAVQVYLNQIAEELQG